MNTLFHELTLEFTKLQSIKNFIVHRIAQCRECDSLHSEILYALKIEKDQVMVIKLNSWKLEEE